MITFPLKTNKENAAVSPLFGKAKYFAFYDGENLSVEENPYGKGSKLINWFNEKGVDTIVIKEMGSKPFEAISKTAIKVLYAGNDRVTTNEVLENYTTNSLKELSIDELQKIVKEHKGDKSSSCHSHSHEGETKKSCHKKMVAQNPYVFLNK
ncbi:NifB/NifX family molybdenum-iron cluster-binding protein [Arcobacter sp.]|uniref:NifB/NifX family molybdenum-iron cluster-binding protein n=1 Tax=unclassified Arcobacter TaxID=2593671 RepID=UPI003AFFBEB3